MMGEGVGVKSAGCSVLLAKEGTWDGPAAWDRLEVIKKRDEQHGQGASSEEI